MRGKDFLRNEKSKYLRTFPFFKTPRRRRSVSELMALSVCRSQTHSFGVGKCKPARLGVNTLTARGDYFRLIVSGVSLLALSLHAIPGWKPLANPFGPFRMHFPEDCPTFLWQTHFNRISHSFLFSADAICSLASSSPTHLQLRVSPPYRDQLNLCRLRLDGSIRAKAWRCNLTDGIGCWVTERRWTDQWKFFFAQFYASSHCGARQLFLDDIPARSSTKRQSSLRRENSPRFHFSARPHPFGLSNPLRLRPNRSKCCPSSRIGCN